MITIIIPILNGEKYIENCFNSIFAQSFTEFQVVVFDNGSTDRTRLLLQQYPVRIIASPRNLGWAKANNICLSETRTQYVLLLNVDTFLHRDCLKVLYQLGESKADLALASPALTEYSTCAASSVEHGHPLIFDIDSGLIKAYEVDDAQVETSFVPGTAMFANLKNIGTLLRFREDFYMYHEDVELSLRILTRTPYALYYVKDAVVAHDSKQSFSKVSTCRLALRNLFSCLTEYQDYKSFLRRYPRYCRNLWRMYWTFYEEFYPVAYPLLTSYYLSTSVFKMSRIGPDLRRLREINQKLQPYPVKFEFIF